jgi:hypothetical protein
MKSALLGSASAILAIASANAADLPSRKSAPVEYVKVCNAYGSGFFFIPGTETCLRIGGRVRADYLYNSAKTIYGSVAAGLPVVSEATDGQSTWGTRARGQLNVDARTRTSFGTVQTAFQLRMDRTTGGYANSAAASSTATSPTLALAFVRFAGFTAGLARDNFIFMNTNLYHDAHFAAVPNNAKQLAYTATFGGGMSATIALQDRIDSFRGAGGVGAGAYLMSGFSPAIYEVYNSVPQINGNFRVDQAWGSAQLSGAYSTAAVANATDTVDMSKAAYAVGAGLKINLPMLAKGDSLQLTAAYANGMTDYTSFYSYASDSRNVGGYVTGKTSYVVSAAGIENVKSWNVAAVFEHFWAPQYRSNLFASYASLKAPTSAKNAVWNGKDKFGDMKQFDVGAQFAWLPVSGFEIGAEVVYTRATQDVALVANTFSKKSGSGVSARLRVQRDF